MSFVYPQSCTNPIIQMKAFVAIWSNMDRPRDYHITYMESKIWYKHTFTKQKQIHRHRKQTYVYQRKEGEGGINYEFGISK